MKKFKFLGFALFAVALTVGFVSCGDDEDSPISIDAPKNETPVKDILATPIGELDIVVGGKSMDIKVSDPKSPLARLLLSSDGHVVAFPPAVAKAPSRAYTPAAILYGIYVLDANGLTISVPGLSSPIIVNLDDLTKIMFGGVSYDANITEIPATEILTENICRTWNDAEYQAVVMFDNLCAYNNKNKDFIALQNDMLKTLEKQDVQLDILQAGIETINIFNNGTVVFKYTNGDSEEGEWKWTDQKNAVMEMTINGNKVIVDVRLKKGTPNEVSFIVSADFTALGNAGVHSFKDSRLIITMKN